MSILRPKPQLVTAENALPGRADYLFSIPETHYVTGRRIREPFERDGLETAVFGMGCFWGAEKDFWQHDNVFSTAVGYAGGFTPYPTYEETCTGRTGHAEAVRVIFDPADISYAELLSVFFENHDPTQGMRQGNDVGSQYRSAILYTSEAQREQAEAAAVAFGKRLAEAGYGAITTEIAPLREFYYAEDYHQQYLAKNPYGYCPMLATGVSCPVGLFAPSS
ncbi:peptide-methionine (S)-S-oxide reductase MsrA [Jatrophihabitans sp.]|uniref:peptide-methionine (S)-S-oxide reductase MsrA n=1 Tax=Jatrophihabitans sp. TaxID=1932789 RepID=UPI002B73BD0F|nr:peptide-methionine (S)-S-oxide reductase MsrA [Jatrophihabitans sp.]